MIQFDQFVCGDLDQALGKEWLETNGLGGFASSTITGANTRRYHGLLTAALQPPVGRTVLLSKLEETVIVRSAQGEQRVELTCNEYPGVVHPQGHQYLRDFRLDPFPVFTYRAAGITLRKSVFMKHGENTTVIQYSFENAADADVLLEVRPLLAFQIGRAHV